ncbi:MAG TPA: Ig-like domain-containing protein, partial [Mycobacteriales bacterium]|nr:Ig-like domain-containing protein [Mycobacteriales bacterium]
MNPLNRALVVGALSLGLGAAMSPGSPALATTDPVSGSSLLAAPTGLTPNDGTVRKTVTLNWAPVPGATSYSVEVGRDASWSDTPVYSATAKVSQLVLPVSLPHGSYVWRVAALKGSAVGHWSSETADPEFTRGWTAAPTALTPVGAVGARPEFSWTPLPFASAYEVQVTDKPFIQPPGLSELPPGKVDTCFTARTRVTFFTEHVQNGESNPGPCFSTLLGDGSARYWRVRALDRFTGDGGPFSTNPGSHGISDLPPSGTPDPNVGSDCAGDTGGGCDPAAPSETSAWSTPITINATAVPPVGGYVATNTVTLNALTSDPDGLCVANTPSAGLTTCRDFPTLSWTPAPGATRYRVTVALDAAMTNVQRVVDTRAVRWTPTDSWPEGGPNHAFYVTVQACLDDDGCGVAATPVSFRKVSPRTAITSSVPPVAGEFTLAWQSYADALSAATGQDETQDAYAYHVQVAHSDHPSFDDTVDDQTVDQTSYMAQKSYGDGAFLWRVQAVDSAGHKLPWSTTQAFTRDATPPRVQSVTPSVNVAVKQPLKLVFTEPVTGVSASSVALSPAVAHVVSVTGPNTATLTPTSAMVPGATYRVTVSSAVHDLSGNVADPLGPTFKVSAAVDDKSPAFSYGGSWRTLSSSNATGGTFHSSVPTSTSQTTATTKFAGVGASVVSCLGPSNGYLDVYVDNVKKARVSLYRSFTGCGVKVVAIT